MALLRTRIQVALDLRRWQLVPRKYTLRTGPVDAEAFRLTSWQLQGSRDGVEWELLRHHANEPFPGRHVARSWDIEPAADHGDHTSGRSYRMFRVVSLQRVFLSIAGPSSKKTASRPLQRARLNAGGQV